MNRLNHVFPAAAGAIAGGVIALVVASGSSSHTTVSTQTVTAPSRGAAIPTSLSGTATPARGLSVNQIYQMASPGVVDILVTSQSASGGIGPFGGGPQETQGEGAGVVYNTSGDILTDEHVVSGATSVKVTFQNGLTAAAKVVGSDPGTDVGVIHVNVPASELHPIPLADSNNAQVGDPVVAIGSPFSLPETTTSGIVSAVGRTITAPNNFEIPGAIQTDAAINPGNSGGPLLDASGDVLGLNDQIQTNSGSSAGVGFATPSNTDARIANLIIAGKPIKHAYVGVGLNPSPSSTGGAQISSVQPGSPASNAGIERNDLVTAINGRAITSTEQFISTIDNYAPGQKITLTIKRGNQTKTIPVTLGTRPQSAPTGR
jgi:putative serine protease PepD